MKFTIRENPRQRELKMPLLVKLYAITLVAFIFADSIWLGVVARRFYQQQLGYLLSDRPNLWAAAAFYALFIAGVVAFAILPALSVNSIWRAMALGGFFGLVAYATYDLTNHATVKNWPWVVTFVDLAWGTVLSTMVSCVGYLAGRWLQAT
ncbi:MAG: DUF2177 family protein [Pirellulales bacterium]